ncbi:MAG: hypothetical protein ICV69_02555 [Thermoleophilaceae bacterium]|nr:hypothetical protein [Thermoleophilaceae bacterium]
MVAQRRRLGAAHSLEPVEVGVGHRAERRRRVGRSLGRGRSIGAVALYLAHEPVLGDDRGVLVEVAGLRPATAAAKLAPLVALEPSRAEPPLHRPTPAVWEPVAPAGLVDGLAVAGDTNDQPGSGNVRATGRVPVGEWT